MSVKSFVSLYFGNGFVQLILLDAAKKACLAKTTVDIPEGLISASRVTDVAGLAKFITSVWEKSGVKEKSVAVAVPEFSTFVKSFAIPNLRTDELAEAVAWRMQEVVPTEPENIVMDWKIVDTAAPNREIQAVAITKDVLSGYIDAVGKAGLSPIAVETPSLALSRISDHNPAGKLVVFASKDEALVIIGRGEQIFGSSVCAREESAILATATSMTEHYNQFKIDRVIVGGLGITEQLMQLLKTKFGADAEWVHTQIPSLPVEAIQQYLVPISLQYKDPKEPRDETTINLLPESWVELYATKKTESRFGALGAIVSVVVIFGFTISLACFVYLESQAQQLAAQAKLAQQTPAAVATSNVASVNSLGKKVKGIMATSFYPQEVFSKLSSLAPDGITITSYKVSFETALVTINGVAATRESLIEFKKKALASEEFADVEIPLSYFVKETNADFELRAKYVLADTSKQSVTMPLTIPL